MTASRTPPASRLCATSAVTATMSETVDEVDPAVGVPRQPVGVHGAGDDLAGRRPLEAVLRGLADQHRRRGPAASPRSTSAGSGGTPRPAAAARPAARSRARRSAPPGCRPSWSATTRWPQIQPVTAPNAPERAATRNSADADETPPRLDEQCGDGRPGQAGHVAQPGRGRRLAGTAGGPHLPSPARVGRRTPPAADPAAAGDAASSSAAASSSDRNGPGSAASRPRGPVLHDAAAVEHRDLLGALGRREAVGDQQAGAPGEQPLGGAHDLGLGDRVHAGGGLVEDDHPDVAHQQPRERDELLLTGGEGGAAGPEQRVQPVRAARPPRPRGRARRPRARPRARGTGLKSAMFSARVPARISVRWVTTPTAARSCCRSTSSTSTPPSRTEPRSGSTARDSSDASVDLPEPVRPTRAHVCAGRDVQVHVLEGEAALVVGEVQVAELHVERPVGQLVAADRLALGAQQPAQPEHGPEARLQVRQVPRELVDLADEHRRDQEQGHQRRRCPGGRRRPARRRRPPCAASTPCSSVPVRRPIRLSSSRTTANRAWTAEASSVQRRTTWAWPRLARRSSRPATPSSIAAAWSVHAASSSTLRAESRGAAGARRPARPPRRGGTGRTPATTWCPATIHSGPDAEHGADRLPGALPQQRAHLVGVVVDPVQHLADGLLGQGRQRLVQGGVEQVGTQPALGTVDDAGPQGAGGRVEDGGPDDAGGQQPDQRRRGVLGQPPGDQRPQ